MKKITKIAAIAVLVMGVAATLQPANAICSSARLITSGYSYVITPGCEGGGCGSFNSSMTDDATGVFWAIGDGNTLPGVGIDSGSFAFVGGWGYFYQGYPVLITSTWAADAGIDGCIDFAADPLKCMAVLVMDNNPDTGEGAFALATKKADNLINYDFSQDGDINLISLGAPVITNSVSIGEGASVDVSVGGVSLTDIQAGLYLDAECPQPAGGGIPGVILGYQLYKQDVPSGASPGDNDVANWQAVGPLTPLGDPTTANVGCGGGGSVFITAGLVFDSNFQNVWLSGNATKVNCDATLADPEDVSPRKPRNRETPRSRTKR